MDSLELTCKKCGARYKLRQKPPQNRLKCKKCGAVMEIHPTTPRTDRTGQTINGCSVRELLSKGERADVYRAEQLAMRRKVALKILGDEYVSDKAAVEEFLGAARLAAAVRHPNIVSIYDVDAEVPCFSMEYVEGSAIGDMLSELGPPPPADAVQIAISAGSALSHTLRNHTEDVRISTDTVMLSDGGEVKVLPSAFTSAQAQQKRPGDPVADLGRLLYALLAGTEPGPDAKRIEPPDKRNPGVSVGLGKIAMQMLRGGSRGYSSVASATQALRRLSVGRRGPPAPREHAPRRKPPSAKAIIITLAICAACAAIAAVGVWLILRQTDIATRLREIRFYLDNENHTAFIEAGEEFIKKYPSHALAEEYKEHIESAKRKLAEEDRKKQAREAIAEVMEAALNAPHLVGKHLEKLDEIAQSFSDVHNIRNSIEPSQDEIKNIWYAKQETYGLEIKGAASQGKFADAHKKMDELRAIYALPGAPDAAKGEKFLAKLNKMIDKYLYDRFYRITNNAWQLAQEGKTDEAEKLYRDVIDNWGSEEYAERARKRIDRLHGKAPEPEEENE